MKHWLMKTEPDSWSWDDQVAAGPDGTGWTGVRNHQAKKNMVAMAVGDEAFFYHSQVGKAVVGIVRVSAAYAPDPTDASGRFGMVRVTAVRPLAHPVTLEAVKAEPSLADMALVGNSRLSVQPVTAGEWAKVLKMAEG